MPRFPLFNATSPWRDIVLSVRDRLDLFRPANSAGLASECGFFRAIRVSSSRLRPERTLAKLSIQLNYTVGSRLAGWCSPLTIAKLRAFIRL